MVLSVQRISPFRVCNRPLRHALGLSFQFAETKWLLCFYFFILELVYLVFNRNRNFLDRAIRYQCRKSSETSDWSLTGGRKSSGDKRPPENARSEIVEFNVFSRGY